MVLVKIQAEGKTNNKMVVDGLMRQSLNSRKVCNTNNCLRTDTCSREKIRQNVTKTQHLILTEVHHKMVGKALFFWFPSTHGRQNERAGV